MPVREQKTEGMKERETKGMGERNKGNGREREGEREREREREREKKLKLNYFDYFQFSIISNRYNLFNIRKKNQNCFEEPELLI